jgi:hypothetical protein
MFRSKKPAVHFSVTIAKAALESIFDDCDRFDADETGGRLLGTYQKKDNHYEVELKGLLEAGPNAERSPVYFMQDGDYQEKLFRAIEEAHPEVEHLGNWHTHHVNGLQTLSGGDKTTYTKTVNHASHNTDFFYALLVVRKNARGNPRYQVKHFFFRRNDPNVYEVPAADVGIVNTPLYEMPNVSAGKRPAPELRGSSKGSNAERASDQQFFSEFYPDLKPLLSKTHGTPYWKGELHLVDGSQASVVAMEGHGDRPTYIISTACRNPVAAEVTAAYRDREFPSARHAVVQLERDLNQALYLGKKE